MAFVCFTNKHHQDIATDVANAARSAVGPVLWQYSVQVVYVGEYRYYLQTVLRKKALHTSRGTARVSVLSTRVGPQLCGYSYSTVLYSYCTYRYVRTGRVNQRTAAEQDNNLYVRVPVRTGTVQVRSTRTVSLLSTEHQFRRLDRYL